jgi:hypothetical protein
MVLNVIHETRSRQLQVLGGRCFGVRGEVCRLLVAVVPSQTHMQHHHWLPHDSKLPTWLPQPTFRAFAALRLRHELARQQSLLAVFLSFNVPQNASKQAHRLDNKQPKPTLTKRNPQPQGHNDFST